MAYAFRLQDVRMAYIRLSRSDLGVVPGAPFGAVAPRLAFALRLAGPERTSDHPLERAVLKGDTLNIANALCEMERILQRGEGLHVSVVVRHPDGGKPDHVEPLLFHQSFFMPLVDYARRYPADLSAPAAGAAAASPAASPAGGPAKATKPGLLAAFTHAYDDVDMLRFWEAHYARLAGHRNLYVIDHGSEVSPCRELHPDTNVVRLPRAETDHADIARFCGWFQRFLLTQYRFVLHTDADELLVDEQGEEALLERLAGGGYEGIIAPGRAFDVIQDLRSEGPLRLGQPLGPQRSRMLPNPMYRKPLLASEPASWVQGFHQVFEEQRVRVDKALWLLHLQSADFGLLLQKNRKWNAIKQSRADRGISPQNRPADEASLTAWYGKILADKRLLPIPEGLRARF